MASWNGELEYLATNVSILKYSVGVSVYWYEKSENGENSEVIAMKKEMNVIHKS